MKTLILSLLLFAACECAGQSFQYGKTRLDSMCCYTCVVTDTIFYAPSGKVLRVVDHRYTYHPERWEECPPENPVRITVKTGCPVCGSEESRPVFMIAGRVEFRLEGVEQVYVCTPCGTLYTGRRRK